ncbi:MAG TPA: MBL fold metallo-hydrolase [Vicinamibacteria bacterium]|nr:MBL fold metallo-hydrolase [Vicinamibacteria bacterium]
MNVNFVRLSGALIALSGILATGCDTRGDSTPAPDPQAKAHYLANEGVLIVAGETRIVFDPLFRNDFDTYRLLPPELERALFAGEPPFTGLDAVFISHYHEDHFSPADILRLLRERAEIRLYAPTQAVKEIRKLAQDGDDVFTRVTEIRLEYKDPPSTIETGGILVEAVRIPHSGWPDRQVDTENIVYRVTLDESTTVAHLGDADTSLVHFDHDAAYWGRRRLDMAFPPYWYFESAEGRRVLDERLKPAQAVGIHVPVEMTSPDKRSPELAARDLFVTPGETRDIP